nr:nitrilase and fragile histidine triad fusion protein NitFhit [Onthophagus taurus]
MYTQRFLTLKSFLSTSRIYYSRKMSKCTIGVGQMTSTNNKEENLNVVKRLVQEAADKKAKMIFLPEACDYLATHREEAKTLAEELNGPLIKEYLNLAKTFKMWLSIGGFHEIVKDKNDTVKLNNCHIIINDQGNIVSVYRKLHLFDVSIPERNINLKESDDVVPGKEIVEPVQTPCGLVGLAICYDLRFPELSVLLRKKGASILTFPSAFTQLTGQAHWEVLLRARAIENQCYVIAAAQYGNHNKKRVSFGQTMVVDPWGKVIGELKTYSENVPKDEELLMVDIDLGLIDKIRMDMPVLEHRRDDIYKIIQLEKGLISPDSQESFSFAQKTILSSQAFLCTQHSFAFTNIRCVVPGHVLVASKRIAKRLEDLSPDEISDLFQTVVKVQRVMETVHGANSSTICVQDGKCAGQTVPHVHVHILPRKSGDFDRNDDIYQELANHDRDDSIIRPPEEMVEEATLLRKYFYLK